MSSCSVGLPRDEVLNGPVAGGLDTERGPALAALCGAGQAAAAEDVARPALVDSQAGAERGETGGTLQPALVPGPGRPGRPLHLSRQLHQHVQQGFDDRHLTLQQQSYGH